MQFHDHLDTAEDRNKPSKQIRFKTSVLRSDLCDYSDAYIVVKGDIALTKTENRGFINVKKSFLAFKNNTPFTYFISKLYGVLIDNTEYSDVAVTMYNLLEYSKNFRKITGTTSITGKTSNENQENAEIAEEEHTNTNKNIEIMVPLKHLSNFCRTLNIHLINCEVYQTLTWSKNCLLTNITTQTVILILMLILLYKKEK